MKETEKNADSFVEQDKSLYPEETQNTSLDEIIKKVDEIENYTIPNLKEQLTEYYKQLEYVNDYFIYGNKELIPFYESIVFDYVSYIKRCYNIDTKYINNNSKIELPNIDFEKQFKLYQCLEFLIFWDIKEYCRIDLFHLRTLLSDNYNELNNYLLLNKNLQIQTDELKELLTKKETNEDWLGCNVNEKTIFTEERKKEKKENIEKRYKRMKKSIFYSVIDNNRNQK